MGTAWVSHGLTKLGLEQEGDLGEEVRHRHGLKLPFISSPVMIEAVAIG